jgi:hypothetical protein
MSIPRIAGSLLEGMVVEKPWTRFKLSPKQAVMIRFDDGDYERLKEIAQDQGTNGTALIRKAVKDIIKAADTP